MRYVREKIKAMPILPRVSHCLFVCCFLSQTQIEDINLVRGDDTGKSRGFAFVKYEDAMSCILAVDNFTGTKVLGRSIGVDHVEKYRLPKELLEKEEANRTDPGHAYQGKDMVNEFSIQQGQDLFAKPAPIETKPEGKEERKEVKRKRKEDRHQHRQEREERREVRAGKQREKRGTRYREGGDDDNNDDEESNCKQKRKKRDRREEL